ncbi:hypothetical protein LEP1GSC050_1940 [Leptospira broomii serovar Hurstbridge str. 5399]|uniref:Uncharacterized protein n=1 Tax=Leptospira broomii serovar Hurstbridge str. 5399 TaxID=1049789 RepID=T0F8R8_9LEPT|nr:hypothetical protein LEP1GSC050_1940 [Leptospira broomii serovar Hurstbridge str. 5399]
MCTSVFLSAKFGISLGIPPFFNRKTKDRTLMSGVSTL